MTSLLLATRYRHKRREFAALLGRDFQVQDVTSIPDLPDVEESGRSFAENAALKATAISRIAPGLVLADDSGLQVDALGGAPGVRSARYAGEKATDAQNVAKLLAALATNTNRRARFCCMIVVASRGEVVATFAGEVAGTVTTEPRGQSGFGYDPVFVPDGFAETFAEL